MQLASQNASNAIRPGCGTGMRAPRNGAAIAKSACRNPAVAPVFGTARNAVDVAKATQQKIVENVAEYFLEENPVLVRPQAVADFSSDVTRLRDDVERLAKRIEKLKESR